jgi:hypothetical protein
VGHSLSLNGIGTASVPQACDTIKAMATQAVKTVFEEEKELIRFTSEERTYQIKSRDFYSTILVLAVLIGIILFFIEGIMPVLLDAAVVFVIFALHRTPPGTVQHVISNKGITTGGAKYPWEDMDAFWFEEKGSRTLARFLMPRRWPGQLILVLPVKDEKVNKESLKKIFLNFLQMEKPPESTIDRFIDWFKRKVPLE